MRAPDHGIRRKGVTNPVNSGRQVHVLGPFDEAESVAEDLLDRASRDAVVVDLSAGQLMTPHLLQQRLHAAGAIPNSVQWINGQEHFADRHAKDSRKAYIEWLADVADRPIVGERSIKELFTYKGQISLWWFTLMAVKPPKRHPYRWLFYMIAVLRDVKAQREGATWHLWMPDENTATALEKVFGEEETVLHDVSGSSTTWRGQLEQFSVARSVHVVWRMVREIVDLLVTTWRSEQSATTAESRSEAAGKKRVLFQTYFPHSWAEIPDYEHFDSRVRWSDHYFGDAPWRLKRAGFDVRWMPEIHRKKGNWKEWQKAKSSQSLPDVQGAAHFSWRQALHVAYCTMRWTVRYLWYFEVKNVQQQWYYEDLPLGHWLPIQIRELALGSWRKVQQIEQYRSVCEALKPDAVLYRNEFYAKGRAVSAALKGRTKLIGVQHGLIGQEHTVYQFDSSEIASDEEPHDFVHHCPAPDIFAVFGERFATFFEEWDGFPSARVEPVGGVRHDALVERYGNLSEEDRNAIRMELGLPLGRPVLLLCTGERSLVPIWTDQALCATEAIPEALLAVKLHQYQGGEAHVHKAAEEHESVSYRVFSEGIYPLIAASDVVIGSGSTVLIEADLLGTPAVALIPPYAYQHYVFENGDGLVQEVSHKKELVKAVRTAVNRGRELSSRTISAHMSNAQEQACQRIERLISES